MIGVSPAYFLSRSGPGFGPDDIVSGLPFLARTGYKAFQAEVFLDSALPLWTEAASRAVVDRARTEGLHCSAFVAHFLGTVFTSRSTLSQGLPPDQVKTAVAIASSITSSVADDRVFVVPIPAFAWQQGSEDSGSPQTDHQSRFRDILGNLHSLCNSAGFRLALELLPGNVLGGSAAFLTMAAEPGFADLGLLLDTGHFWAMGEAVQDLPPALGSRIIATHLCDNDGTINLSLCPGDGTIPFQATIKALTESGYAGSLDLEIVCPKDSVETEYLRALTQFKQLADKAGTLPDRQCAAGHHTNQQPYKESI